MAGNTMVGESYARCNLKSDFIDRFYEIFLASNPDLAPLFANTDFSKQKELLKRGISMLILFDEGNTVGRLALERLGKSHGIGQMEIQPDLYRYWLDSLIKTVSEMDSKFCPELEQQWRIAMEKGITKMTSTGGY